MTTQIRLSVSLISTNERLFLEKLLPTLVEALKYIPSEILLVDNACSDSSSEFIERNYTHVILQRNGVRECYSVNHNRNLSIARGQYILIMNSDMTVAPDALIRMIEYMDGNPDIGILCPRVLNQDGSDQFLNRRNPTVLDLLLRRGIPVFLQPLFRKRLAYYEMRDVGYDRNCEVEQLTGAFMFCRADLLRKVGGFDPRFPLYFEDYDLCRRVQKTHRTVYFHEAHVVHYWQRAPFKSVRSGWLAVVSAFRYFNRWGFRFI